MRYVTLIVLLTLSTLTFAEGEPTQCPLPEGCGYTMRATIEVLDAEGNVTDADIWTHNVGTSYMTAIAHKYQIMAHIYGDRAAGEPTMMQRVLAVPPQ